MKQKDPATVNIVVNLFWVENDVHVNNLQGFCVVNQPNVKHSDETQLLFLNYTD